MSKMSNRFTQRIRFRMRRTGETFKKAREGIERDEPETRVRPRGRGPSSGDRLEVSPEQSPGAIARQMFGSDNTQHTLERLGDDLMRRAMMSPAQRDAYERGNALDQPRREMTPRNFAHRIEDVDFAAIEKRIEASREEAIRTGRPVITATQEKAPAFRVKRPPLPPMLQALVALTVLTDGPRMRRDLEASGLLGLADREAEEEREREQAFTAIAAGVGVSVDRVRAAAAALEPAEVEIWKRLASIGEGHVVLNAHERQIAEAKADRINAVAAEIEQRIADVKALNGGVLVNDQLTRDQVHTVVTEVLEKHHVPRFGGKGSADE